MRPTDAWAWCERCGKRGYPDRDIARRAVRHMRQTGKGVEGKYLGTYRCPARTGLYHVGNSARSRPNLNDPNRRDEG